MKEKTICFTGHREISKSEWEALACKLKKTLIELIKGGYCVFCAGGALGFDTMAARAVLELKPDHPQIRLILILPCVSQPDRWAERDVTIYETIKASADEVIYVSREYTRGCMHKRNRRLVNQSSVCVCYLTEPRGGTFYTVNYARTKGLPIVNLAT